VRQGKETVPTPIITDEDLLRLSAEGYKVELVDGEIRMSPAGMRHAEIVLALGTLLRPYVRQRGLGRLFGSDAGYYIPGGALRSPDISYVAAGRLPAGESPAGFAHFAPDLAAEVLSPWDQPLAVRGKVAEYLRGGVKLVWVIDPETRQATVHRAGAADRTIAASDELEGEDVIPGFRCRLSELFD
jgi:Uma2 family endonuclease